MCCLECPSGAHAGESSVLSTLDFGACASLVASLFCCHWLDLCTINFTLLMIVNCWICGPDYRNFIASVARVAHSSALNHYFELIDNQCSRFSKIPLKIWVHGVIHQFFWWGRRCGDVTDALDPKNHSRIFAPKLCGLASICSNLFHNYLALIRSELYLTLHIRSNSALFPGIKLAR